MMTVEVMFSFWDLMYLAMLLAEMIFPVLSAKNLTRFSRKGTFKIF